MAPRLSAVTPLRSVSRGGKTRRPGSSGGLRSAWWQWPSCTSDGQGHQQQFPCGHRSCFFCYSVSFSSSSPPTGPKINSVDASPIPCWGWANRKLKAGGMWFQWKFLNAKVAFPILGANFLASFNLLVDLRHSHLVWGQLPPNHLATPAGGSPYCKCGFLPAVVVVDSPSLAGAKDSSSSAVAVDSSSSAVAVVPSLSPLQENHLR